LLTYEEKANNTIKARLTTTIQLSKYSDFIKFDVDMNEIPIESIVGNREQEEYKTLTEYQHGKDVMFDWEFMDGFDTDSKIYVDSNGLDMH